MLYFYFSLIIQSAQFSRSELCTLTEPPEGKDGQPVTTFPGFCRKSGDIPHFILGSPKKKGRASRGMSFLFSDISLYRQTQRSATALRIHLPLFTRSRETAAPMAQPAGMDHQMELAPRGVR